MPFQKAYMSHSEQVKVIILQVLEAQNQEKRNFLKYFTLHIGHCVNPKVILGPNHRAFNTPLQKLIIDKYEITIKKTEHCRSPPDEQYLIHRIQISRAPTPQLFWCVYLMQIYLIQEKWNTWLQSSLMHGIGDKGSVKQIIHISSPS